MRRTVWFLFLSLAALVSCRNDANIQLKVRGTVSNNPSNQSLMLDVVESDKPAPRTLDTVDLEAGNARFSLTGLSGPDENLYRLRLSAGEQYIMLVDDVKDIEVSLDLTNLNNYYTNSPASNSLHQLLNGFNEHVIAIDSVRKPMLALKSTVPASDSNYLAHENMFNAAVDKTENYLLKYADTAGSHTVALYALGLGRGQITPEKMEPVMTNLARRFADIPQVISITGEYFAYMQKSKQGAQPGKPAPEITLPDPSGNNISLSSLRGKYVLVDFWASWCRPCRDENPNIVAAYNAYKEKNFTILGVSLDREKSAWVKAINDDKLAWSHISDLKYWNSEVVPVYNIEGIPFNVLVDPEGRIVAMNLRGPALKQKLGELLN